MNNELKRKEIANGVFFNSITDKRFKVNRLSVNLITRLDSKSASDNAFCPFYLTYFNQKYPRFTELQKKLSSLYGASLYGDVRKIGDNQIINISISSIDNRYALEKEPILEEISDILISSVLTPVTNGDGFIEKDTETHKNNLIDSIESELNEKQVYASNRSMAILCEGEPAGINKYGDVSSVKKINAKSALAAYNKLVTSSKIEIICVGASDFSAALAKFEAAFKAVTREAPTSCSSEKSRLKPAVKEVSEEMPVTQCKMVMGFKTASDDSDALALLQKIYGGTTSSKLFMNVREKLSLCYYCSARFNQAKGIMEVHSGVEKENIEKARTEILAQLEAIKNGDITEHELSHAKLDVKNSAATVYDTTGEIETWYLSRLCKGDLITPEEYAGRLIAVEKERIVEAAKTLALDSVYTLVSDGSEEATDE